MLPYRAIEIPAFEEIQQQLLGLLAQSGDNYDTGSIIIDASTLWHTCPKLKTFVDAHDLQLDMCRFFVTEPHGSLPIHQDGDEHHHKFLALNLPVLNCLNSEMQWWDQVELVAAETHHQYSKFKIPVYDSAHKVLTHSLELAGPHVVRIDLPHSVVNHQDQPRAIFSMRFKPEPLCLWY